MRQFGSLIADSLEEHEILSDLIAFLKNQKQAFFNHLFIWNSHIAHNMHFCVSHMLRICARWCYDDCAGRNCTACSSFSWFHQTRSGNRESRKGAPYEQHIHLPQWKPSDVYADPSLHRSLQVDQHADLPDRPVLHPLLWITQTGRDECSLCCLPSRPWRRFSSSWADPLPSLICFLISRRSPVSPSSSIKSGSSVHLFGRRSWPVLVLSEMFLNPVFEQQNALWFRRCFWQSAVNCSFRYSF